jgi:hypothetical protein
MKLKEYQNVIDVNLRGANLPATMTNERSHVVQELADDLIKQYESGEIYRLEFFPKLFTDTKNNDMSTIFHLLRGFAAAQ